MAFPLLMLAAATGITDTPCTPLPMPAAIEEWRPKTYAPTNAKMLPAPVAEAAPYLKAYQEARTTDWADLCHYREDNAAGYAVMGPLAKKAVAAALAARK